MKSLTATWQSFYTFCSDISFNWLHSVCLHLLLQENQSPLRFPQALAHQLYSWHIRSAFKSSSIRYSYWVLKFAFVNENVFRRTNNISRIHCHLHNIIKNQIERFCRHSAEFIVTAKRKSRSYDRVRNLMLICLLWSKRRKNKNWS